MMFRTVFQQTFARGVRHQSTAVKAQNAAQGLISKVSGYVNSTIAWTKITGELAKQIYLKEKLSPPSIAEFQSVYETLYKQALSLSTKPFEVLSILKNLKKNDYILYGSYLVQFAGLYSLGEIIGRRQLVGYPSFGSHEEHH